MAHSKDDNVGRCSCVCVASSDAWSDYIYIRIIREHFLLSAYFVATESDRHMLLLTRVYGILLDYHPIEPSTFATTMSVMQ